MGMTAPNTGAILSSTPFYQNFFNQPVSYTTDVLSQIPQTSETVESIIKADPNLTGYKATPDYGNALSSYIEAIGGNPNYYQSVTNPTEMAQLNTLQRDVADAKTDYWNTALNTSGTPLGPSSEAWKPALNENLGPVGVQDGLPVMSSWGASPIGLYYITKEGNVEYSEPEDTRLGDMFITGVGTLMGGIAGGPALGVAAGAGLGAAAGSVTSDLANDRSIDYLKAGTTGLATYAGGVVAPAVTSAVSPYIGNVAGTAVGGATAGATAGGISGAPAAIKTGSWEPVLDGATRGGVTGLVTSGLGALSKELTNLDAYGEGLAGASSTAYDGGVDYVPVGAGSLADSIESPTTLNQLMTELETPSGGGMSLANDPIPTESINPTGTPEFSATQLPDTDTSSMNIADTFQYAEPAYKTAKTAYNLYNIGKRVYNNYQNYQDAKDQQPVSQTISQPVQTPITAPVGVSYTLGNMPIGEDERRAWGRVLV